MISVTNKGGRSREGAWIEIVDVKKRRSEIIVAPVRERGLKYYIYMPFLFPRLRRSREGAWIEM